MPSNNTLNKLAMAGITFASCVFLMVFTKICKYICCSRHSGEGGGFGETLREGNNFVVSAASSRHSSTGGLNPAAVATLPIVSYRRDLADDNARGGGWAQCAVCLDFVKEEEMVRQLPKCKHLFHVECIDMWLYSHSTCPLCRATVEPVGENKEEEKMEAHAGLPPV